MVLVGLYPHHSPLDSLIYDSDKHLEKVFKAAYKQHVKSLCFIFSSVLYSLVFVRGNTNARLVFLFKNFKMHTYILSKEEKTLAIMFSNSK